jgi:hypothetical protein
MTLKLKNPQAGQFPPGGWPFRDPRTGWNVAGVKAYEQDYSLLATKIIDNRKSNPHLYPPNDPKFFDHNSVVQEIFAQKYVTNPGLFVGGTPAPIQPKKPVTTLSPTTTCPKCGGTNFEPTYCPTCGGRRINGYKCKSCGSKL